MQGFVGQDSLQEKGLPSLKISFVLYASVTVVYFVLVGHFLDSILVIFFDTSRIILVVKLVGVGLYEVEFGCGETLLQSTYYYMGATVCVGRKM